MIIIKQLIVADDQSCYLFGSVLRNNRTCVPEGSQVLPYYDIHNPHDSYTNFTAKWFRSANNMTVTDLEIMNLTHEYQHMQLFSSESIENCTQGPLYRDMFILFIYHFTSDKNGY